MENQTQSTDTPRSLAEAIGTPEAVVGRRVKALREARGWSQQELATRMVDHGFSWRQTTVAKTEGADRPIRVNEAARLAGILGTTINDLLTVPIDDYDVAHATVELAELRGIAAAAQQRVMDCERRAHTATTELAEAREEARLAVERLQVAQEMYKETLNGKQEHQEETER